MTDNPFKAANLTGFNTYPKFHKSRRFNVFITEEAYDGIKRLIKGLGMENVHQLAEMIGLHALRVSLPTNIEENGVTTDMCRDTGYEDGINNYTEKFNALHSNGSTPFEQAYLQGFIEGNFIRLSRNKTQK